MWRFMLVSPSLRHGLRHMTLMPLSSGAFTGGKMREFLTQAALAANATDLDPDLDPDLVWRPALGREVGAVPVTAPKQRARRSLLH